MKSISIKKILIIELVLCVSIILFSCISLKEDVVVKETYKVPEAANQFALDKETETSTVEETKAHHIYPEDFKMTVDKEVSIGEKNFLTRINYIYNNIESFANTTIIVEGMYGLYTSWDGTFEFPMVYRNGPGCCGDDQHGGFYMVNIPQNQFELNDWIEVKGTPFLYEHKDSENEVTNYLFLLVSSIEKRPTKDRKAEMVNN